MAAVFLITHQYFHLEWTRNVERELHEEIAEIQESGLPQLRREIEESEYYLAIPKANLYSRGAENQVPVGFQEKKFQIVKINNRPHLITSFKFRNDQALIGEDVGSYLKAEEKLSEILQKIFAAILLLVTILGYLFSRFAIRPVKKLNAEVAKVDFSHINPKKITVGANKNDEIVKLQATLRDALERLKQYNQQQQEFISMASHELRTPLAIIKTSLELASKHPKKILEAQEEVEHLEKLINQLLIISKAQNTQPSMQEENLSNIVKREVNRFKKMHPKAKIVVEIAKSISVATNHDLFLTTLRNILSNAVKFNDKNAEIKVQLSAKNLIIENSHKKKVDTTKISLAFYQENPYNNTPGIGLGLYLVRKITKILDLNCYFSWDKGKFRVTLSWIKP
jgi:signal transduction histidine kinase